MNRRKYISYAVLIAALAGLLYGVPAIENNLVMAAAGALCLVVMAVCVYVGRLDELNDE